MKTIQEINPLLLIAAFCLLFVLYRFFASNIVNALWGTLTVFLLMLLLLPGGRLLGEKTAALPTVSERASCLASALAGGAPWTRSAESEPDCRHRPVDFPRSR